MEFLNHLLPETTEGLVRLNIFLHIIHSTMVWFVLLGVFFKRLIPLHFTIITLIWISWIGLGIKMKHLGYCILTDWHWQVKYRLAETDLPASYITYMLQMLTGVRFEDRSIAIFAGSVMVLITITSGTRFIIWWRSNGQKPQPMQ